MKFEVVRLVLTWPCINYNAREARVLGGSGACSPRKILDFRPSEVVSNAIFE